MKQKTGKTNVPKQKKTTNKPVRIKKSGRNILRNKTVQFLLVGLISFFMGIAYTRMLDHKGDKSNEKNSEISGFFKNKFRSERCLDGTKWNGSLGNQYYTYLTLNIEFQNGKATINGQRGNYHCDKNDEVIIQRGNVDYVMKFVNGKLTARDDSGTREITFNKIQ